jgi:phage/plasmid-associated DNA primase
MAEPEENSTFNSSKIKMFTAKSIKTRTIFETPIEWAILFTIIFGCNNLPKFDDSTPAFKRRVRIIYFPFSFKEKEDIRNDNHREKQFFQFDGSFYNEFINMLIYFYQEHIHNCKNDNLVTIPKRVQEYTQTYFDDNDRLGASVKELFTITGNINDKLTRKEVYDHYSQSVEEVKKYRVGQKKLYDYLRTNLDLQENKTVGIRYFVGIKLNYQIEHDLIDDDEL